jgi:hypothetical protein
MPSATIDRRIAMRRVACPRASAWACVSRWSLLAVHMPTLGRGHATLQAVTSGICRFGDVGKEPRRARWARRPFTKEAPSPRRRITKAARHESGPFLETRPSGRPNVSDPTEERVPLLARPAVSPGYPLRTAGRAGSCTRRCDLNLFTDCLMPKKLLTSSLRNIHLECRTAWLFRLVRT